MASNLLVMAAETFVSVDKVVKQFLPSHDSLLIAIVDRSFSVFIHVCDLLPFCVNENRTQTILRAVFQWRRCGDLNPSAGGTDLPDFESGPFNHLGTSPYKIPSDRTFCE